MGLTLRDPGLDGCNRAGGVALGPRPDRNEPCPCGSGSKYKRCCLERDESVHRQWRGAALPAWMDDSRSKLRQFEKYVCNVFALPELLANLTDKRRDPKIPTFDVVNSLLHTAVLRIPSINALEGDLKEGDFQKLIGRHPTQDVKAFSADVVANVLDKLQLDGVRTAMEEIIGKAERNKAFRDGCYSALRCVAIDGWEPFASYDRHCPHCLVRKVKVKRGGEIEEVEQYYHRYVVAMLLGAVLDVVLGIEPVLNEEARRDVDGEHAGHEGELTAARRLIDSLHDTYGTLLDAFVFDALYANGPVMTQLDQHGYGGFLVLKKDNHEPLKEALALWQQEHGPCEQYQDPDKKEHIQFWDCDDIETLDSYEGKVRVIRAVVSKPDKEPSTTWCFAIVGKRARQLARRTALQIIRARWHIEDTGFNQWIQYWNFGHVFRHTPNALMAVLLLWALAFDLLQLFVYRRLGRCRRPKDPTNTIRHIVEVMLRDVAALPEPIPWTTLLWNTS